MRLFSYRNRTRFSKIFLIVLFSVLALLVLSVGVVAYLDRYIVYDHDGAHLDRAWNQESGAETQAQTSAVNAEIQYVSDEDDVAIGSTRKITGYYITQSMLEDLDTVQQTLDAGNYYAVMLDLKDAYGNFYYSSGLSGAQIASSVDTSAVKDLISTLKASNTYLIARIPAFADQQVCLRDTTLGLPLSSGALWADQNNCYWMDPGNSDVIDYLEGILTELQGMGFREVVLDGFRFPDTDSIVYDETEKSKDEVLAAAAQQLQSDMATLELKVSFGMEADTAFPTQLTDGRLYVSLEDGAAVDAAAEALSGSVVTPATQIVFVSESRDTRFDDYGHLRPVIESTVSTEE
ncbi:MAG: putative glycoside hydrolase [Oscillospiraceae bacterium]|nr:putative glycoside hydrolase [Oscillospiraceae bacterium]